MVEAVVPSENFDKFNVLIINNIYVFLQALVGTVLRSYTITLINV